VSLSSVPQSSHEPLQILRLATTKKLGMACGRSQWRRLDFCAHDLGEPGEHRARDSSPSLTHASAKPSPRPDVPVCDGWHGAIALWAIWKDKSWAGWWAVAASSMYFLGFLTQFVIPVRPAWDHYLSSLIVGVAGAAAFSWRDKPSDASRLGQPQDSRPSARNLANDSDISNCPTCGFRVGYLRINIAKALARLRAAIYTRPGQHTF
jgi:hypothetical protein